MKLKLNSPAIAQAKSLLERTFESTLPSQDVLADYLSAGEELDVAKYMSANTGQIIQIVQGRMGIQTGIPSNLLNGFSKVLSAAALEQAGSGAGLQIAQQSGQLIMDTALSAASQIPMLGWAMQIAMFVASLGQKYANSNKPFPPPLRYNQDTDNNEARKAIALLGSVHSVQDVDWTPIFLPRASGLWDAFAQGDGAGSGAGPEVWALRATEPDDGLGCIPPGLFGSRSVQIEDFHGGLGLFSKQKNMKAWYRENVFDAFQFLPSLTRIGQAAWYAAGSNDTAAVWNLDYDRISKAWQDYFTQMMSFYAFLKKVGKDALDHPGFKHKIEYTPLMQAYSLYDASTHASRVSGQELKAKPNPVNNTIAGWAKLWCQLYEDRARAMCKTAAVAYGSFEQPWFNASIDNKKAFVEGWKDLLQHPAIKAVDPDDILDYSFRQAAISEGAGTKSPKDFPGWPAIGTSVPQRVAPPKGLSVSVAGPSGGGVGGIVLVGAALAGAGAWAFLRRRK